MKNDTTERNKSSSSLLILKKLYFLNRFPIIIFFDNFNTIFSLLSYNLDAQPAQASSRIQIWLKIRKRNICRCLQMHESLNRWSVRSQGFQTCEVHKGEISSDDKEINRYSEEIESSQHYKMHRCFWRRKGQKQTVCSSFLAVR